MNFIEYLRKGLEGVPDIGIYHTPLPIVADRKPQCQIILAGFEERGIDMRTLAEVNVYIVNLDADNNEPMLEKETRPIMDALRNLGGLISVERAPEIDKFIGLTFTMMDLRADYDRA